MAEDQKKPAPKKDDGDDRALILLGLGLVLAAIAVPAVLGVGMYLLLRGRLRRAEGAIIGATCTVALLLGAQAWIPAYFTWLWALGPGSGSPWAVPILPLIFAAGSVAMLGVVVEGTAVGDRIKLSGLGRPGKSPLDRESILPTDAEKARARVVAPPGGGALTVSASQQSILNPQNPGEREFPVGVDRRGSPVMLSEREIGMHGLLLGSTGSGKTEAIKAVAGCLLDLGWSGMILDLKEDTKAEGLRDFCLNYATHAAMPYQELALSAMDGDFWFNPLAGMGPDEARDTVLSLNEFDDAFWQAINKKCLGQVVNLFYYAHQIDPVAFPYPTMRDVGRMLSHGPAMPTASKKMLATVLANTPSLSKDDFNTIAGPSQDEAKSAIGFGAKLTFMYDTQAGRHVLRPGGERRLLDVTQSGLTYVGLDSQGKADLTRVISSAVLQRMSVYAAQRTTGASKVGAQRFLIVDESNFVDRKIVMNLLSRARSAGISMLLCTQGPKDWEEDFPILAQNTNVAIIMSQGEPESARICADYLGQREQTTVSQQVRDGELLDSGSTRTDLAHVVGPDDLRRMSIGEAIMRVGKPAEKVTWMTVKMRDPRTGPRRAR